MAARIYNVLLQTALPPAKTNKLLLYFDADEVKAT